MPAPLGTWEFHSRGFPGQLNIPSVDNTGRFTGTIDFGGSVTIQGLWNDTTKQISFTNLDSGPPNEEYIGFLGDNHPDQLLILAGWFLDPILATPRNIAWYAIQSQT